MGRKKKEVIDIPDEDIEPEEEGLFDEEEEEEEEEEEDDEEEEEEKPKKVNPFKKKIKKNKENKGENVIPMVPYNHLILEQLIGIRQELIENNKLLKDLTN